MDQFLMGSLLTFLVVIAVDQWRGKRSAKIEVTPVSQASPAIKPDLSRLTHADMTGEPDPVTGESKFHSSSLSHLTSHDPTGLIGAIVEIQPTCHACDDSDFGILYRGDRLFVSGIMLKNGEWFWRYNDINGKCHSAPMTIIDRIHWALSPIHKGQSVMCRGKRYGPKGTFACSETQRFKIQCFHYMIDDHAPRRVFPVAMLDDDTFIPLWDVRSSESDIWPYGTMANPPKSPTFLRRT